MPDNANNSLASTNALHTSNAKHAANTQHTGNSHITAPDIHTAQSSALSDERARVQKYKIFIIGLPRTGTTSVSVALLEQGLKVAHMAFTKQAFMIADAVSDAPCFSDYQQLDLLFPEAKFVYLDRDINTWLPSMQMLLGKMAPHLDAKTGRFHPILKRSFRHTFAVDKVTNPADSEHLIACYQRHQHEVFAYFNGREDFISINVSQAGSLSQLLQFLGMEANAENSDVTLGLSEPLSFPKLNVGRNVASWGEYKHPNKVNTNSAGPQSRKFFDYTL
ncbi:sulfotransferase family protein [Shewanella profunda]|uniref:sulfotransferase n=1 Tax=Shewanella profunda TaxID=254793 RepID=UPI00200EDC1F|nr:sulfotransferase [Shewanella profunda]MCL1092026.1 sulfotransferase family protein [Shewanella profunda]